jgi:ADP-ribose pyrophosphatase YjhB (NUDIX family)
MVTEQDKDIESVAQPDAEAAYIRDDAQIGDAFKATSLDSYQVKDKANERLAKEAIDLRKQNEKLKIELGNLIKTETPGEGGDNKDEGGFKTFVKGVGEAFKNVADGAEKKLTKVYDDREKRMMFLSGLNTIIEASSFTPITQSKSPLGKIASGQKKGFLESEAIETKRGEIEAKKLQALKQPKRVADPKDKVISELFKTYSKTFEENKASKLASNRTYSQILKNKNYTPTGILENFFAPLEEVADSLGFSGFITDIRKKYAENAEYVPSQEEIIKFKQIIDADSGNRILGKAKELYPVSNVDLQLLLKGAGSLKTNPGALKVLVSAEQALNLIEDTAHPYAQDFAYPGGDVTGSVNFKSLATDKAAKELSEKFKPEVKKETLITLYGTEKDITPFKIIQAKLYQDILADKTIPQVSAFDKFLGAQEEKDKEVDDIITKYQKKKK